MREKCWQQPAENSGDRTLHRQAIGKIERTPDLAVFWRFYNCTAKFSSGVGSMYKLSISRVLPITTANST
jgi:hypothetical protein